MPVAVRAATRSPNAKRAMRAVATISKLFSSDTLSADERESPAMSSKGAAMSSATIASAYGISARSSGLPCAPAISPRMARANASSVMPAPAPRYSSAASMFGAISASRTLEKGVLSA